MCEENMVDSYKMQIYGDFEGESRFWFEVSVVFVKKML